MDNRHGLVVDACVVHATGTGSVRPRAACWRRCRRASGTVGADKAHDTRDWIATTRQLGLLTPHVAQKKRSEAIVVLNTVERPPRPEVADPSCQRRPSFRLTSVSSLM